MAVVMAPITLKRKNYPLYIELKEYKIISGVIIREQMKTLDYSFCNAKLAEYVSDDFLGEILERIDLFFDINTNLHSKDKEEAPQSRQGLIEETDNEDNKVNQRPEAYSP